MRRIILAGNWKMNKTPSQAQQLLEDIVKALPKTKHTVAVFPPYLALERAVAVGGGLLVGAQNCHFEDQRAFTGEISADMLRDTGATWVLAGHSERRHVFGESDELVARKTAFALTQDFKVMLCVGEMMHERETGQLRDVLARQLATALEPLPEALRGTLPGRLALAYEPVWAIGTGKVAGPVEVLEAHAVLRALLTGLIGATAAELPILYGGSVKPDNASALVGLDNVDGLLVGGASLEAQSFLQIIGS